METTLYNDQEQSAVKNLKRAMTLDFNGPSGQSKKQKIQTALLQSPDLNMLKLASPELERMIIQANGMVTTTPTPTQFLFPKVITEEQEAYAQGFVAALEELQREKSKNFSTLNTVSSANVITAADGSVDLTSQPNLNFTYAPASNDSTHIFTTTTSLPGGLVTFSNPSEVSTSGQYSQSLKLAKIKEEPQTVPSGLNSPPLSPIDMENQEVIKLERKRARNRVAARKCRTRKLERIARLEDKVKDLKGQNSDLANTASKLRDEVCQLKRTIIGHVNTGCQIMMTNNITF